MLKKDSDGFTQNEAELMATYEELYGVSPDKKVTHWWGDMHLYRLADKVKLDDVYDMLDKSLKSIRMTREEFAQFEYAYRSELRNKMKEYMPQKYEAVIIFNKPMLFTNLRIDKADLPEGMYRYDIRDGGMDGNMCEFKDYVAVNHWGTVLSRDAVEPRIIDGKEMTSKEGIIMTDDDYNYTGEEFTVDEFVANYDYLVNEYCEPEQNETITMS